MRRDHLNLSILQTCTHKACCDPRSCVIKTGKQCGSGECCTPDCKVRGNLFYSSSALNSLYFLKYLFQRDGKYVNILSALLIVSYPKTLDPSYSSVHSIICHFQDSHVHNAWWFSSLNLTSHLYTILQIFLVPIEIFL